MSDALLLWPLAYLVHSTLMLGAVWIASRWIRHAVLLETLWRCAFFGAFLTASLQPLAQLVPAPRAASQAAVAPSVELAFLDAAPALPVARTPAAAPVAPAQSATPSEPTPTWRWWLPPEMRLGLLAALLAWALVAAGGLLRLVVQWVALVRACARLRPNVDRGWTTALRELAHHYALRRTPALKVGARWASPLVGPHGVVCLPDWCLAQLHGTQRDAVLAHELAHLSRRDPAWRVASRVAACIGWIQPLNMVALRRLDALAEQACDARAAHAVADRGAVAETLYLCASRLRSGARAPGLNVGMVAARSPLVSRIENLMRHDPARDGRRVSRRTWAIVAAVVAGSACLLPTLKVRGDELGSTGWRDFVADALPASGPRTHVMTRSPGDDIDVWIYGAATLRDDSDDLKTGRVSLRETTGGVTRRIDIAVDAAGTATRRYSLDSTPHPLDDAAKQWAEKRWNIVVETLLNPEQRLDRLLRRGGPELALRTIEKPIDIGTQHALIEAYAGKRTLDPETVQRLIAATDRAEPAGDDHDRVLSLRDIALRQHLTPAQRQQFLAALITRANDSDSTGALQAVLVQLDGQTPAETLGTAAAALRALPSDHARREVLDNVLEQNAPTATELALQVSPGFTSEFDHRSLLEHVARSLAPLNNPEMTQRYADSARQIRSPFERRAALLALIDSTPLKPDGCMAVLNALDGIDSAGDLTPVLLALARRMPSDSGVIARYRQVARVLPTFERGQAEQALDQFPPSS